MAFYGGNEHEMTAFRMRMAEGPYRWFFWALILFNVLIPQLLWFARMRHNVPMLFVLSLVILIGMWLERFVIVVSSLSRAFMQSKWQMYYPTRWDWGLFLGTIGLFVSLLFLFIRFLPMISAFEMRELVARTHDEAEPSASSSGKVEG